MGTDYAYINEVPARLVPDNLKAAIVRASFVGDPLAQRAYRECAEHYGFLIDPNPPRSPHLKGKVEQGGVHYVARNFLAGRDPAPLDERHQALLTWAKQIAGCRLHGTTKQRPLAQFEAIEQAALVSLPRTPYDPTVWKQVKLYRDCYLSFEGSYYSAPHRLVGQQLLLRAGARTVQLYTPEHELVATHDRAHAPGERLTCLDHRPSHKVPGLVLTRESCRLQAEAIGPATTAVVSELLDHRPVDRLRSAGRIIRLAELYGMERLEQACTRAQYFGEQEYPAIRRILESGREALPLPGTAPSEADTRVRYTFARQATDLVASLFGGVR